MGENPIADFSSGCRPPLQCNAFSASPATTVPGPPHRFLGSDGPHRGPEIGLHRGGGLCFQTDSKALPFRLRVRTEKRGDKSVSAGSVLAALPPFILPRPLARAKASGAKCRCKMWEVFRSEENSNVYFQHFREHVQSVAAVSAGVPATR
jgi:hypothetical protein